MAATPMPDKTNVLSPSHRTTPAALSRPHTPVVSVSPRDADSLGRVRSRGGARAAKSPAAFRTARGFDRDSFDDVNATLRTLLDEAAGTIASLDDRLRAIENDAREPGPESELLQERLRLGARMLKAFQVQIDRADAAIGELAERQVALAARAEEEIVRAEERMRENTRSHARDADAADERLRALEDRVAALLRTQETVEVDAAALSGRVVNSVKTAETTVASATAALASIETTLGACEQVERRLDERLARANETLVAGPGPGIGAGIAADLADLAAMMRDLARRVDEMDGPASGDARSVGSPHLALRTHLRGS